MESAVSELSVLLDIEPEHVEAWLQRGRAYMKLRAWNESARDLSTVIHLDPGNAVAFYYRGCLLNKLVDHKIYKASV